MRDALRSNKTLAQNYAVLKKELAVTVETMDEYVMGKTEFITEILAASGMSMSELSAIRKHNENVIPPIKS